MALKPSKRAVPLATRGISQLIELTADGTALGKSLATIRLRHHYEQHGVRTTVVWIESAGVQPRHRRASDVFIATESFTEANGQPGALAGLLAPAFVKIAEAAAKEEAVLVDWAGGQAQNWLEVLAATGFDDRLAELEIRGRSVVVTTNATARMHEAAANLADTARLAPGLARTLLLNERNGAFRFIAGTASADAYRSLLDAAQGSVIRFARIRGESWQSCEDAGFSLPAVVRAAPALIAEKTKLDPFTAAACVSECGAWWAATEKELSGVFPFAAAAK